MKRRLHISLIAPLAIIAVLGMLIHESRSIPEQSVPVIFVTGLWPFYASDAISIDPEPIISGEQTNLCAHVINTSTTWQTVTISLYVASFGIGLPFSYVGDIEVSIPPLDNVQGCVSWIPPASGPWSIRAVLSMSGYNDQRNERNIDMTESLEALLPHSLPFNVGNSADTTATISLGLVAHLQDWSLELSQDVFLDLAPGEVRSCTLRVTPPVNLPEPGETITDVEAFSSGQLIGGFRKIFPLSYSCSGITLQLMPNTVPIKRTGFMEERGAFITAIRDFEICALGMELDLQFPQAVRARIFEADGTVRGALLAEGVFYAVHPDARVHYVPINYAFESCRDYDISFEFHSADSLPLFNEPVNPAPFDVGGVIRIRDGELSGNASNLGLPHLSLIVSPFECSRFSDLEPPEFSWNSCADPSTERGVFITAYQTLSVCAVGWEADFTDYVPTEITATIYEASGITRGAAIAHGGAVVTNPGMQTHSIPLAAALEEGKDYDVAITFPASTWSCINESQIALPFTVDDAITVRDGEEAGNAGNTILSHFALQWSPGNGGELFNLAKQNDVYPPANSSTQSGIAHGIYVTSLIDQQLYALGWTADVPEGAVIGARIYAAVGTNRGALISEGSIVSSGPGTRRHCIPVAVELSQNTDYDFEIVITSVNEWRYWNDSSGLPYEPNGVIRIVDGESEGNAGDPAMIDMQMHACNITRTGVGGDLPDRPPRFHLAHPYPNPASNNITINYGMDEAGPVTISVFDVNGRKIAGLLQDKLRTSGPGTIEFNTSTLATGVYFLKMQSLHKSVTRKITVVH
jgi:hypothetical protein